MTRPHPVPVKSEGFFEPTDGTLHFCLLNFILLFPTWDGGGRIHSSALTRPAQEHPPPPPAPEELQTLRPDDRVQRGGTLRTEKVTATVGRALASTALCVSNTRMQETALMTSVPHTGVGWAGLEVYHAFRKQATCANCCHRDWPLAQPLLYSSPPSRVFHFFNINTVRFITFRQYFHNGD